MSSGTVTTPPILVVNPCSSKTITAVSPVEKYYNYVISNETPTVINLSALFNVNRPSNCTSQEIVSISSPDTTSATLGLFTSLN